MKRSTEQLLALLLASPALCAAADVAALQPTATPFLTEINVAPVDKAPGNERWGARIAVARLAEARGGTDRIANEATLGGTVSGNAAINVTSGTNTIDAGSFANSSGLPVVIQNSGSNVLIQNATVINLQLQ